MHRLLLTFAFFVTVINGKSPLKLVCYYDTKIYNEEDKGKFGLASMDPALQNCTHLVYLTAVINPDTYELKSMNPLRDITQSHYKQITELKKKYHHLKVLLAVGHYMDDSKTRNKYLTLLESADRRSAFVNSAHTMVKAYGFDGIDLGWEFPTMEPENAVVKEEKKDKKEEQHMEQFTALALELYNAFKQDELIVSLSVMYNVNSSAYFDTKTVIQYLDFVNILAYGFNTPDRNPKNADYPAPIYALKDRNPDDNVDALITHWIETGAPANKLIFTIPSFGSTWKMTNKSNKSGVPPLEVDGPGAPGLMTKHPGLLYYGEICSRIDGKADPKEGGTAWRKVDDPTKKYGSYAFRLPDSNGEGGIWVGFDGPEVAANKASYARSRGLGGVAIDDLNSDDWGGLCGDKFPIIRAAKLNL